MAAISDPRHSLFSNERARTGASSSNVMLSLQHDTGRWCTEYTYSAEDGMWGVRCLHNFGKIGATPVDPPDDTSKSSSKPKRVDEEDAMEGGLKGRISAGAEFYLSRQEKSAGGMCNTFLVPWSHCTSVRSHCWRPLHDTARRYASVLPTTGFRRHLVPKRILTAAHHNNRTVQSNHRSHNWGICGSRLA